MEPALPLLTPIIIDFYLHKSSSNLSEASHRINMASINLGLQESGLAGIMFEGTIGDNFPVSLSVRKESGFYSMKTSEDETNLLGVCQSLKMLRVRDREVEEQCKQVTLRQSIIKFYDDYCGRSG